MKQNEKIPHKQNIFDDYLYFSDILTLSQSTTVMVEMLKKNPHHIF